MTARGQTLVEFALVLPVFMFMLLGFAELSFAVANRAAYQNGIDVVAAWAAAHPGEGWDEVADEEAARTGCEDSSPSVSFPDGGQEPGDRVVFRWACPYRPVLTSDLFDLTFHVESAAVVPGAKPTPEPSPSTSP